ncbi:GNAT family N-acetyltransferase [Micromonospora globbae]|jgi:RimJ/RimL family protein N-acetyltransferase|uniref:N-acetyltransferase n=1 Tax=Micromonospora globbae TaxID=1894969 RepID=A0A420EEA0_9ACTN|nr:GNAT family protein [Micromonospora globbae]RKF18984.1 N-acetyltransferase [Micromonospora globbae]
MNLESVVLRPVEESDLEVLSRFDAEPELAGSSWYGFRDAGRQRRRFHSDGWLGDEDGKLMVTADAEVAGFVAWASAGHGAGRYRSIGIALLPGWRGQGIGTQAQRLLCQYLFAHTAVQRIEAGTQPENVAEQRALQKVGFTQEGVLRSAEFRDGAWRDVIVYGLLRSDRLADQP